MKGSLMQIDFHILKKKFPIMYIFGIVLLVLDIICADQLR
jgi:hypothetical protein